MNNNVSQTLREPLMIVVDSSEDPLRISANTRAEVFDAADSVMDDALEFAMSRTKAMNDLRDYLLVYCDGQFVPATANRQLHSKVFELCVAYELGMMPWDTIPLNSFASSDVLREFFCRRGRKPRDYGIDCASRALNRTAQAKWYAPGSQVRWRDVSTFYSLSVAVGSVEPTLVVSEGVKVVSLARALPLTYRVISNERMSEICEAALGQRAQAEVAGRSAPTPSGEIFSVLTDQEFDELMHEFGFVIEDDVCCPCSWRPTLKKMLIALGILVTLFAILVLIWYFLIATKTG